MSKNQQHTPGPWVKFPDSYQILDKDSNFIIATVDAATLISRDEKKVCLTSWNKDGKYTNLIEHALTAIKEAKP